ncbi:hypothetical protein BH09PLA1_BH09PLA1_07260 [soil metagenome]
MRRTIATWLTAITISVAAHAWSESSAHAQPAPPTSAAAADFDPAESTRQTIQQLSAQLTDAGTGPGEREEAARRLLSHTDPAAKAALIAALREQSVSSIAVARAIADSPRNDPDFVEPLFASFGANRTLTDAAAVALGNYRSNADVMRTLADIAGNRQRSIEDIRVAAIRGLGSFSDKRAAETLMILLRNPNESIKIRNRAADALSMLSGSDEEFDFRRWDDWWNANSRRGDEDFRAVMLERKASLRDRDQARISRLAGALDAAMRSQYQLTPVSQRESLLLDWLRAGDPEIRARAATQVQEDWAANKPIAPRVYEQMRNLIGDSNALVRRAVVRTLGVKNDMASLEPLLTQLVQESDSNVREQIASALKNINDVRAAPSLVKLLGDPSPAVVRAAVGALQPLGKVIREQRPALAEQLATLLREIIDRTASTDQVELRADAVAALVPLKQRELIKPLYLRLLKPQEDVRVRIAALQALAEIGDHNTAISVLDLINDSDDSIVLQAVKTLGNLAPTADQANALQPLLIGEKVRADPTIKEEAWHVLESILPSMTREQLTNWAEKFRGDPDRQISIRLQLAKVLTAEKDLDNLARTQSQIARNYMDVNQPDAAVPFFRAALEYRQGNREAGAQVDELVEGYMQAALNSGAFADAITFAEKALKNDDGSRQSIVGSLIRGKVEELGQSLSADDLKRAVELIKRAKGMSPPLGPRYGSALDDLQKSIDDRLAKLNQGSTGPGSVNGIAAQAATRPAAVAGEGN